MRHRRRQRWNLNPRPRSPRPHAAVRVEPKLFTDFRKMFDEMGKEIDAVTVEHARPHARPGQRHGHAAGQARLLPEAADAHRSSRPALMRETGEEVRRLHADGQPGLGRERPAAGRRAGPGRHPRHGQARSTSGPTGRSGRRPRTSTDSGPTGRRRCPTARPLGRVPRRRPPMRPSARRPEPVYHPFAWRGWWDFGTGALGDMACHTANMAFRAAEARPARRPIEAEATDVNPETCPASAQIDYAVPGPRRHAAPAALDFYWYEGKRDGKKVLPPEELLRRRSSKDGREAVRQRLDPRRRQGRSCSRRTTTGRSSGSWPATRSWPRADRTPEAPADQRQGRPGHEGTSGSRRSARASRRSPTRTSTSPAC